MSGELDLEAMKRLERHEYALPPDFEVMSSVSVDGPTWDAILAALARAEKDREYLREKNDIIKAYAGPTGMTPEDVAAALERVPELERDERTARDETAGLADYLKHVEAILDGERDRANAAGRRAERVEAALVAVREQERDEDWFPEDRPVSLVHLAHLQEPNPDCVLCACETGETIGG